MADQRQQRAARGFLTGPVSCRDAGGLSEPVLRAALCRSLQAAPRGARATGERDTDAPMPSPPRDSDVLVGRDGLRALAAGAGVGWKPGQTGMRPRAPKVRVV